MLPFRQDLCQQRRLRQVPVADPEDSGVTRLSVLLNADEIASTETHVPRYQAIKSVLPVNKGCVIVENTKPLTIELCGLNLTFASLSFGQLSCRLSLHESCRLLACYCNTIDSGLRAV